MNREDFTDGSVHQIIFDYWDQRINATSSFENALMEIDKTDLVDFIIECQGKGLFRGYAHD